MSLEPPPTTDDPADPAPPLTEGAGMADVAQERVDMAPVVGSPWGRALRLGVLVALVVLLGVKQGLSMLIVVAAIVVMIFLHELGHYVMAKRAGMLVTEFFLGFGPRIWSFRRGETEYGLKAIPAGAYVKIIGMSNMEEVDPALESRTYRQKSFSQRVGVAVAGSTMHFLIAFVLLFIQFAFIGDPTTDRWAIGDITPGSAAAQAGLQEGDEIRSLDGNQVGSFDSFRSVVAASDPGEIDMVVVRDGQEVLVPIALSQRMKLIGTIGEDIDVVDNGDQVIVGDPFPEGEADAAGMVGGATLVAVNGEPVSSLDDVIDAAEASNAGVVVLTTEDDAGATEDLRIDLGTQLGATEPAAFVGVGSDKVLVPTDIGGAVVGAGRTFGETVAVSVVGVGKFIWPPNLIGFVADTLIGLVGGELRHLAHRGLRDALDLVGEPADLDHRSGDARQRPDLPGPVQPGDVPGSAQHLHRRVQPVPHAALRRRTRRDRGVREGPGDAPTEQPAVPRRHLAAVAGRLRP